MKQALQALIDEMEYVLSCINEDKIPFDGDDFHAALRLGKEALANQEQGEPVAEAYALADKVRTELDKQSCPSAFMNIAWEAVVKFHRDLVYTTPQQRTWVGLTDEEVVECWARPNMFHIAHAIESKLKKKNT
jgi:hypothetical protein